MFKVACISDVHNKISQIKIPKCDLLIIAGDLTMLGTDDEFTKFNEDLVQVKKKAKQVVAIGGNHDWGLKLRPCVARALISNVDYYLEDSTCEIEGFKFFGSPWQPEFGNWCWNLPRGEELQEKWSKIPHGLDFLVTHGPPFGILDDTITGERVGGQDLLAAILDKRPRYSVFGHIYYGYGEKCFQDTTFINASTCNERYQPVNPPIVFEI